MKNFIFKSKEDFGLIKNVSNKLDMLLTEQRHQRQDLVLLLGMCSKLTHDKNLQKQVDQYFDEDIEETSPQTEQTTKVD